MSNLPDVGVRAVVENVQKSLLDLDKFNTAIDNVGKKAKDAAKNTNPLTKALDGMGISVNSLKAKITQFTGLSPKIVDGIGNIVQSIVSIPPAAAAAVIGIGALAVAFLSLGERGAALPGLVESFDRLTNSVGITAQTLLQDLRKASAGTISDFDLIRRANLALVGTGGEFGNLFGKSLPKLLEAARAAARATGQDANFLFQSLVTGIKRASPLLIDNTGIVLKVGEANEELARQLGKTVEELTSEEKQIAILNATLAAGQELIDATGNAHETAAEKIARAQATITNIFDTLALAVQPAYEAVLDVVNGILGAVQDIARGIAPVIGFIAQVIGGVIQVIGQALNGIITFIGDVVHRIGELMGLGSGGLGDQLRNGAIQSFQAYASGLRAVITKVILPLITGLAKSIADFLIGESPPPKGPLSKIDKGGENLMLSWLDGIAGVSLDPVTKVAEEVSLALGDIGKASLSAVNTRLLELDKALIPFQNRLDIVKSRFDAIAEPAKAALDAIDRQIADAETALMAGDATAATTLQNLDAQREAIQANLDAQQGIVDKYQIQLALAQAQQAQERTLLNIRKSQFAVTDKTAKASEKVGTPKVDKSPTGAGATEPIPGVPSIAIPTLSGESVVPGDSGSVDDFANSIAQFGLDLVGGQEALIDFNLAAGDLQTQINRFSGVDVGARILEKFKGITDAFDASNPDSIAGKISTFFTGSAETPGSIASFIAGIPVTLENARASVEEALTTFFGGIFDPTVEGSPAQIIQTLTADSSTENSIAWFFAGLPDKITTAAADVGTTIQTSIVDPIKNFLTGTEPGQLGGIINSTIQFFTDLPGQIADAVSSIGLTIYNSIVVPVVNTINSMIGAVETGLRNLAGGAVDLAASAVAALGTFAPAELSNAINTLKSTVSSLTLPRIELPAYETPGAARGGVFSPGFLKVGERGEELLYNATKVGVLPNELTQALMGLTNVLASPAPMMIPAGNSYNSNSDNSSMTNNFYGTNNANDVMRRMSTLRARR